MEGYPAWHMRRKVPQQARQEQEQEQELDQLTGTAVCS